MIIFLFFRCVTPSNPMALTISSKMLETYFSSLHSYAKISLLLAVLSLLYLVHSGFCIGRWLLSDK